MPSSVRTNDNHTLNHEEACGPLFFFALSYLLTILVFGTKNKPCIALQQVFRLKYKPCVALQQAYRTKYMPCVALQ